MKDCGFLKIDDRQSGDIYWRGKFFTECGLCRHRCLILDALLIDLIAQPCVQRHILLIWCAAYADNLPRRHLPLRYDSHKAE
jgi:hypothetical protein